MEADHKIIKLKIKQVFLKHIKSFVKDIKNFDDISTTKHEAVRHAILKELQGYHDDKCMDPLLQQLQEIRDSANGYLDNMTDHFNKSGFFSDDMLGHIHNQVVQDTLASNKSEITNPHVQEACQHLVKVIKDQNAKIIEHQIKLAKQSMVQVEKMYLEELQRFRDENIGPFPPKRFRKVCQELFKHCMAAFIKSTEYKNQALKKNKLFLQELDDLANKLKEVAMSQSRENQRKIEDKPTEGRKGGNTTNQQQQTTMDSTASTSSNTHAEKQKNSQTKQESKECGPKKDDEFTKSINQIMEQHKMLYRDKLKDHLASQTFPITRSGEGHVNIVKEVQKLFEMDIGKKLDVDNTHAESIWKNQMEPELEKAYNIQMEKRSSFSTNDSANGKNKTRNEEFIKSPIVFQLTEQFLGMATVYKGDPMILKNENKENWTLNLVGQTKQGKLVYGDSVNSEKAIDTLRETWQLGEIIEKGHAVETILHVGNGKIPARPEILLGYLLKNLKKKAQNDLLHKFNTCFVCIPYFYTCVQRRHVIDAAKVAGFKEVNLINDITALAYEFSVQKRLKSGLILVVTESSVNVSDAAVFQIAEDPQKGNDCTQPRVTMMSHAGSYHDIENDTGFLEYMKIAWKNLTFTKKQMECEEQNKKALSLITRAVINYHDDIHPTGCKNKNCVNDLLKKASECSVLVCRPGYGKNFQNVIFSASGCKPEIWSRDAMLSGAIRKCLQSVPCSVDPLPSSVWLKGDITVNELGKGKSNNTHFLTQSSSMSFIQKQFSSTSFKISSLNIKVPLNTFTGLNPFFRVHVNINIDGIFHLVKVEIINGNTYNIVATLMEGKDYEIVSPFLPREKIKDFKRHIATLFSQST